MIFFIISLGFAVSVSIVKLMISTVVEPEDYAILASMWGVAGLIGSQLIGCIPRLDPKDKSNLIRIDKTSIVLCLCVIGWFASSTGIQTLVPLLMCILFMGVNEYRTTIATIKSERKELIKCELLNFYQSIAILILSFVLGELIISASLAYALPVIICIFYFLKTQLKVVFTNSRDFKMMKVSVMFAQAGSMLLPLMLTAFMDKEIAGNTIITIYTVSLALHFNGLFSNRLMYSNEKNSTFCFISISILCLLESVVMYILSYYGFLDNIVSLPDNLSYYSVFAFLITKSMYTLLFVVSRFKKMSGVITSKFEFARFITMTFILLLCSFTDHNVNLIINLLSIHSLLFLFIFYLLIKNGNKNQPISFFW